VHRRVVLFLFALPFLLFTAFEQLNIKTDISAFFISGKSDQMKLLASRMQTGEISRRYLLSIEQKNKLEPAVEFVDELRQAWSHIAGVSRVFGQGLDEGAMHQLLAFYTPYRYHLYSLQPKQDIPEAFSESAMKARATMIKEGLLGQQSAWMREIIRADPMFLMSQSFGRISKASQTTEKQTRYTALILETDASGLDTAKQAAIKQQLEQVFQTLNQQHQSAYQLEMTGVPVFALTIKKQVKKDVQWISSVSIVLMVLLFLWMFRSLQSLLLVMVILLVSAAMASLMTSWVFGQIYALTLALGTTLIGICVDYPIHSMVHVQASDEQAVRTIRRIWPSLLLGAATTMVGYAALSFTGFPGMQQIALYSAVGIVTALLISRFILPFAMPHHKKPWKTQPSIQYWLALVQTKTLQKIMICLALLSVVWVFIVGVTWQDDLSQLSPSVQTLKEQDQQIRARMQSIEPGRFILIHAPNMEQALQKSEYVSLKLERLKEKGDLSAFYGLYPWLASKQLQQQNSQLARQWLSNDVRQQWKKILEQEGLRSAFFTSPAVPDVPLLDLDAVLKSPAGRYIAGQYVRNHHEVLLTIWLGMHTPDVLKHAFSGDQGVQYVSQKDMMNEMNGVYRSKAVIALSYGALVILLLLAWRYRSMVAAVQVLLPAMASVSFVVTFWVLLGYPLSILHLLGLLLAVAICVDYGIFFYENRTENMYVTYQAIVMSALTTIVAFFSLALAENPALQVLAWTIAPSVLLGFLLCPVLIQCPKKGCVQEGNL